MSPVRKTSCLILLLSTLLAPVVLADETAAPVRSDEQERIAALIEQLDDEEFVKREVAEKYLLLLGGPAIDQIKAATKHCNVEIRRRAERLLVILQRREIEDYMQSLDERISAFVHGESDALPGWEQFKTLTGDNQDSRQLFAAMYRTEPRLLLAYCRSPNKAAAAFLERLSHLQPHLQQRQTGVHWPLAAVSALLWVALDGNMDLPQQSQNTINEFLKNALPPREVEQNVAVRHLIVTWIDRPIADNEVKALLNRMEFALHFNIKEKAIELATRSLALMSNPQKPKSPLLFRVGALFVVANSGNASHITQIEPLLKDQTFWPEDKYKFQIRDLALGVMLLLSEQNFADYKLEKPEKNKENGLSKELVKVEELVKLAVEIAKRRDEVLAKWHAWVKENLKEGKALKKGRH